MDLYKLSALNTYFKRKNLNYRLPLSIPTTQSEYNLLFINETPIYARVAKTASELSQGLMGVSRLDPFEGCLLDFGRDQPVTLWMKNCKINLQAAMLDSNGLVIDIKDMNYQQPNVLHTSSLPVRYALEMSENFFTAQGVQVGDRLKL